MRLLTVLASAALTVLGSAAQADVPPPGCTVDTDCDTATCGGDVCEWGATHACVAAGTAPTGSDGWCDVDADCKCRGLGATCAGVHCTFTLPTEAPDQTPEAAAEATADTAHPDSAAAADTTPATTAKGGSGCATGDSSWLGAAVLFAALGAAARRRARR